MNFRRCDRINDTLERLWHQVGSIIAGLRANYNRSPVRPLDHLIPFARVIGVDGARDAAQQSLDTNMRVGDTHREHEVRVDALTDAAELLAFLDGRASSIRVVNRWKGKSCSGRKLATSE